MFKQGYELAQSGPVCGVKDGVGELARSIAALEAHFLRDVAFAVVEVARPDAAVFVGKGAPAVAVEVVPAVVCAAGGAGEAAGAIYFIAVCARFTWAGGLFDARRLIKAIVRLA